MTQLPLKRAVHAAGVPNCLLATAAVYNTHTHTPIHTPACASAKHVHVVVKTTADCLHTHTHTHTYTHGSVTYLRHQAVDVHLPGLADTMATILGLERRKGRGMKILKARYERKGCGEVVADTKE